MTLPEKNLATYTRATEYKQKQDAKAPEIFLCLYAGDAAYEGAQYFHICKLSLCQSTCSNYNNPEAIKTCIVKLKHEAEGCI